MATESIQQGGGGDRTSITAWEAALPATLTAPEVGQIDDGNSYSNTQETFPINPTSTATATNYAKLTVGASYRHDGTAGSGARVTMDDGTGQHAFHLQSNYFQIEYLEIYQSSPGSSDEGIRIQADYCLISRCILWTDSATADTDGIYFGNWAIAASYIDNNLFIGWTRCAINAQNYDVSTPRTQTHYIRYNTVIDCGASGEAENGIHARTNHISAVVNMNCSCNYSDDAGGSGGGYTETITAGTINWSGTHNACSDTSLTTVGMTTNAVESVAVNTTNFTAPASDDYSLPGTGSALYNVGTAVTEDDSRQDFSIDIIGGTRSTDDIGCFEFIAAAGGATIPILSYQHYHNRGSSL